MNYKEIFLKLPTDFSENDLHVIISKRLHINNFSFEILKKIWMVGEGSGYAGGIISSAVDGIKTALDIIDHC